MSRIFVDTSGFYALVDSDDQHHNVAHNLFDRAEHETWRLVTTNAVVFETHALMMNRFRLRREVALAFLDSISADRYQVVRVLLRDETQQSLSSGLIATSRTPYAMHSASS